MKRALRDAASVPAAVAAVCCVALWYRPMHFGQSELGDVTDSFQDKHAAIKLKVLPPVAMHSHTPRCSPVPLVTRTLRSTTGAAGAAADASPLASQAGARYRRAQSARRPGSLERGLPPAPVESRKGHASQQTAVRARSLSPPLTLHVPLPCDSSC